MLNFSSLVNLFSGKRGLWLPLFFLVLNGLAFTAQAQVDQKPQLETGPPANPTPPVVRPVPVPVPADTTKPRATTPPPTPRVSEKEDEREPIKEKPSILQKLFVGGSGTLGFSSTNYLGNQYSVFNIGGSPLLGYRINKIVAVGPGLVWNYYSFNRNSFSEYGAKVFSQVIIYKMFLAHAEHVVLSSQDYENRGGQLTKTDRYTVQQTLIGGGYRQMASDRFGFDLYVLFNVGNTNGISSNAPVIRGGIIYNLGK